MRDKITIAVFAIIIFGFGIAFFVTSDNHRSQTERRLLAAMPDANSQTIISGRFMTDFETYMQDQFPLREAFRTINAILRHYLLWQSDYGGYFFAEGHLSQMEFPLNASAVHENAAWLAGMANALFEGMSVYYAIIPDKNYFLAAANGFLHLDYEEFMRIVHARLGQFGFIDLFDVLALEDFYRTDIHWRQESLRYTAQRLSDGMDVTLPSWDDHTWHTLTGFRGNFHGAAALPVQTDDLVFLTNRYTDNAIVHTLIEQDRQFVFTSSVIFEGEELPLAVYNPALFTGVDGYDVFLAGAQAFMTIYVPNATTDRELIIFRDSFGSSIAPLLLGAYSKITLVDIRYISSHLLPNFIDFTNQDILFLFSVPILNRGGLLR